MIYITDIGRYSIFKVNNSKYQAWDNDLDLFVTEELDDINDVIQEITGFNSNLSEEDLLHAFDLIEIQEELPYKTTFLGRLRKEYPNEIFKCFMLQNGILNQFASKTNNTTELNSDDNKLYKTELEAEVSKRNRNSFKNWIVREAEYKKGNLKVIK